MMNRKVTCNSNNSCSDKQSLAQPVRKYAVFVVWRWCLIRYSVHVRTCFKHDVKDSIAERNVHKEALIVLNCSFYTSGGYLQHYATRYSTSPPRALIHYLSRKPATFYFNLLFFLDGWRTGYRGDVSTTNGGESARTTVRSNYCLL